MIKTMQSFGEFADECRLPAPKLEDLSSIKTDSEAQQFSATATYEEALDMLVSGAYLGEFTLNQAEITNELCSEYLENQSAWDVSGSVVDVSSYLSGEPECMLNFNTYQQPDRQLRLVYCTVEPHFVSTSDMMRRGAVIGAVVDTLEKLGYYIELYASLSSTYDSSEGEVHLVRVKEFSELLNLNHLSATCHPSWLRRLGFRYIEHHHPEDIHCGYGQIMEYNEAKEYYQELVGDHHYIPSVHESGESYDTPEDMLKAARKLTEKILQPQEVLQ